MTDTSPNDGGVSVTSQSQIPKASSFFISL